METTQKQNIVVTWLLWQFLEVPGFLLGVWKNYINFALNYFSIPLLLKSLFAPWRNYKWNYPKGFQMGEFFSTLISNMFSRIIGALMRIILIAIGVVFYIFVIFTGLAVFLFWIFVPFIIISGFIFIFVY